MEHVPSALLTLYATLSVEMLEALLFCYVYKHLWYERAGLHAIDSKTTYSQ